MALGTWSFNALPSYPNLHGIAHTANIVINDVLYTFGGQYNFGLAGTTWVPESYKFDFNTRLWSQIASLPEAGNGELIPFKIDDNNIVLFRSIINSIGSGNGLMKYVYNITTNTYTKTQYTHASQYNMFGGGVKYLNNYYFYCNWRMFKFDGTSFTLIEDWSGSMGVVNNINSSSNQMTILDSWIFCGGAGKMFRYDISTREIVNYTITTTGLGGNQMYGNPSWVIGSKVYYIGSTNGVFRYFDMTDPMTWYNGNGSYPIGVLYNYTQCAVDKGSVYIVGGYRGSAVDDRTGSQLVYKYSYYLPSPTNVATTFISNTSVKLTWTDNADEETSYVVDRRRSDETVFTNIANTASNVTEYIDNTVDLLNYTYSYRLRARMII